MRERTTPALAYLRALRVPPAYTTLQPALDAAKQWILQVIE